jgi:antitoxin component YwqK of YwqJK toxin-antitoxin module
MKIGKTLFLCIVIFALSSPAVLSAKTFKEYYPDGKLMTEFNMKLFKMHGPFRTYSKTGKLIEEANFKEGKLDGPMNEYYESGKLKIRWHYIEDKPKTKKVFHENGKLKEDWNFNVTDPAHEAIVKYYDQEGKFKQEKIVKKKKKRKKKKKKNIN